MTITTNDAFECFILAKRAKNVVPNTIYLYEWTHSFWQTRWGDLLLADITPNHVRTFLTWLQGRDNGDSPPPVSDLSSASIYVAYRNLRTFFNWCEREDFLPRTPMRNVEPPMVEEKIPDCLTEEEAMHVLECVQKNGDRNSYRDYVIHLFFMSTGVRLNELVGLDIDDLDLRDGYAKVFGKRRKERIVSLGEMLPLEVKRYILKYRQPAPDEPALFVNEQGKRISARRIQEMIEGDIKRYVARPFNRPGPHAYRHTFITFRLRQTRDLKGTSIAAGHSDTRTTERYTHLAMRDVLNGADGKPYSPMDTIMRKKRKKKTAP